MALKLWLRPWLVVVVVSNKAVGSKSNAQAADVHVPVHCLEEGRPEHLLYLLPLVETAHRLPGTERAPQPQKDECTQRAPRRPPCHVQLAETQSFTRAAKDPVEMYPGCRANVGSSNAPAAFAALAASAAGVGWGWCGRNAGDA